MPGSREDSPPCNQGSQKRKAEHKPYIPELQTFLYNILSSSKNRFSRHYSSPSLVKFIPLLTVKITWLFLELLISAMTLSIGRYLVIFLSTAITKSPFLSPAALPFFSGAISFIISPSYSKPQNPEKQGSVCRRSSMYIHNKIIKTRSHLHTTTFRLARLHSYLRKAQNAAATFCCASFTNVECHRWAYPRHCLHQ